MFGKCLDQDLQRIADNPRYEGIHHSSVLITGATGLVGLQLTRLFIYMNETRNAQIIIHLCIRNQKKLADLLGEYIDKDYIRLHISDIQSLTGIDEKIDYIFHCASITNSKMMITYPVDTILTSVIGTENILRIAHEHQVRSAVYVSSMEVYGSYNGPVSETDYGFVDPLAVRSCYPEGKRMCENLCIAYHSQYDVNVKIARLAQTFGAGILPGENRVFAQFARSAVNREDIVLHTEGKSEGNYCYTADALEGLLTILLYGKNAEAYNVCNEKMHMAIHEMAELVAKEIAQGEIKVRIELLDPSISGYASETHMFLSSDKLRALGWAPVYDMPEAYRRMISDMCA